MSLRRVVLALAVVAALVAAPSAPALPRADLPPLALSVPGVDALADADPLPAAFALARNALGLPEASVGLDPARPLRLADAVLALYAAADVEPSPADVLALLEDAEAMPPAWAVGGALMTYAVADALAAADAGHAASLAAAEGVARAVALAAPMMTTGAEEVPPLVFEDPYHLVRLDARSRPDRYLEPQAPVLLVDGGGNDEYVGVHAGAYLGRPVSVLVDLGGDDHYAASGSDYLAQGAVALGGVLGFLYDHEGNDRYRAAHEPRAGAVDRSAYQGGCWGGGGVGLLLDAAGDDSYEARIPGQGGVQGASGGVCAGILLDLGGDDRFTAGAASGEAAQGAAFLGVGLLLNRAGNDVYEATTRVHQGRAQLGAGFLVDYGGADSYNGQDLNDRPRMDLVEPTDAVGLLVDAKPTPLGYATVPYPTGVRDEDRDGTYAVYFHRYEATLHPDGSISYGAEGAYAPLGRPHLGDLDDREGFENVRLDGTPRCVIAVVDSGINPYHVDFRAPPDWPPEPASWIPGFPAAAVPLRLALDAPTYAEAKARDDATWRSIREGVVYTVPGTRIVAAVSVGPASDPHVGGTRVLDDSGHGTRATGAAAGATSGLAPECAVVAVEAGDRERAIRWAAAQPWIDVVSVSIGSANGLYKPSPVANATRLAAKSGKIVAVASGNGFTESDAPTPSPSILNPFAGPAWVTTVGAVAPWNGQPTWWTSQPVDVVSLGAGVRAPTHNSTSAFVNDFGGTSASAPRVAGAAGAILKAARAAAAAGPVASGPLDDGKLNRGEWLRVLYATARAESASSSLVDRCVERDVPTCLLTDRWWFYALPAVDGAEFLTAGYGTVDAASVARAVAAVRGEAPLPARDVEDRWWRAVHASREAFWGAHDNGLLNVYLTQ